MTIAEFAKRFRCLPTHPTTDRAAVSFTLDSRAPCYRYLWTLTDYAVSSVSGPVVWLLPRQTALAE